MPKKANNFTDDEEYNTARYDDLIEMQKKDNNMLDNIAINVNELDKKNKNDYPRLSTAH